MKASLLLALALLSPIPALAQSLAGADGEARLQALRKLRQQGLDVSALPALAALLGDADQRVRRLAVESLAALGAPAVPVFLRALGDRSAAVQRAGLQGLLLVSPAGLAAHQAALREALPTMRHRLRRVLMRLGGDADDATTRALLSVTTVFEGAEWVPALARVLKAERGPLRVRALNALSELGPATTALREELWALVRDPKTEPSEYYLAILPLLDLGDHDELLAILTDPSRPAHASVFRAITARGEAALPLLEPALRSPHPSVRAAALSALSAMDYGRGYVPRGLMDPVETLVEDPDPAVRDAALETLAAMGAHGALERALRSPRVETRALAAGSMATATEALASLPVHHARDSQTVAGVRAELTRLLAQDESPRVRQQAANSLRQFPGPKARAQLVRTLLEDEDPPTRALAARSLSANPPGPDPLAALEAALLSDPAPTVRAAAAAALLELGATPVVERLLLDGPRQVRELFACDDGLQRLVNYREDRPPLDRSVLLRALSDPSPRLRRAASECLSAVAPRDAEAVRVMKQALSSDDPQLRSWLADALSGSGDASADQALVSDADGFVGRSAARAWSRDPSPEAQAALVARLSDELTDAQLWALLDHVGRPHGALVPRLLELLAAKPTHQEAIFGALGRIGPAAAAAVPELIARLPRQDAVETLGLIGEASAPAVPDLVRTLKETDDNYTAVAVYEALGRIGREAGPALPTLCEHLERTDGINPDSTAASLAAIVSAGGGDAQQVARAVDTLIAAVDSSDSFWPEAALKALSHAGPRASRALPTLVDRALDPWVPEADRRHATHAALSLEPRSGERIQEGLAAQLASDHPGVRVAAAQLVAAYPQPQRAALAAARVLVAELLSETRRQRLPEDLCWSLTTLGAAGRGGLYQLLASSRADLREVALEAAAALGGHPELRPALARMLEDPLPALRRGAARRLAVAFPRDASQTLIARTLDGLLDGDCDRESVEAVGLLGPLARPALPRLVACLDDDRLRLQALNSIAAIGSGAEAAAPALRLIVETRGRGCVFAARALLEISPKGDALARDALRRWLPSVPRAQASPLALSLGRERAGWRAEDRALAIETLERVLFYAGTLRADQRGAAQALKALGELAPLRRLLNAQLLDPELREFVVKQLED